MSADYKPVAGDRVRVVLEGEVRSGDDKDFMIGDGGVTNIVYHRAEHLVSVEKVQPPVVTFKPGDVVRHRIAGSCYAVVRKGLIRLSAGRGYTGVPKGGLIRPEQMFTLVDSRHFELVDLGGAS